MNRADESYLVGDGLDLALQLLRRPSAEVTALPDLLPARGIGEAEAMTRLSAHVLGEAARLDAPLALAHMDPPTPWITWAMALWNARLNQNLLHAATSPFASEAEALVLRWLSPFFGMEGGHLCGGSTLANLTALWAARDGRKVRRVVASESAHVSIDKACQILGLPLHKVRTDERDQMDPDAVGHLGDACLVLTAGTTATGAIDPLALVGQAAWTHVDAAWAGPLRLSPTHAGLLAGIERADSVAVSAHKWFFQPKDSALILFKDPGTANAAISFGGSYLARPNVGVQGSRGAAAIPLLATLLAWGQEGMVERIDRAMACAAQLATALAQDERFILWSMPASGITLFQPAAVSVEDFFAAAPAGMLSTCVVRGARWLRTVAANPLVDVAAFCAALGQTATAVSDPTRE